MKIQVDIDLPVPRWARIAALVVVPGAVILATTAIVRAGVPNVFATGDTLSAQKVNDNFAGLDGRITTLEATPGVPSGTIIAFGGATAPTGWLPCDGTQLDGTNAKYAALYAAVGTAYGGNTTSMQFNLPDLRGRFLRGWDHGAGHDPEAAARTGGDAVGSQQGDETHSHGHGVNDPGHAHGFSAFGWDSPWVSGHWLGGATQAPAQPGYTFWLESLGTAAVGTGISIQPQGGAETRPANVAVNYIIKL